jgi:pyruvate-formate lyase-activating enzyme
MILAPGLNDQSDDLRARLQFIKELGGCVLQVDILKLHSLGAGKYLHLGLKNPMEGVPDCSEESAWRAAEMAKEMGLFVTIGG